MTHSDGQERRPCCPTCGPDRGPSTSFDAADFAMVLEVVIPSSRKNDRFLKPREYAEAAVPAYWRLEPDPTPRLHVMALAEGTYEQVQELVGRGRVDVPFPLDVDLDALFPRSAIRPRSPANDARRSWSF